MDAELAVRVRGTEEARVLIGAGPIKSWANVPWLKTAQVEENTRNLY